MIHGIVTEIFFGWFFHEDPTSDFIEQCIIVTDSYDLEIPELIPVKRFNPKSKFYIPHSINYWKRYVVQVGFRNLQDDRSR